MALACLNEHCYCEKLLTNWYRKEMKRILPSIVKKWRGSCNPTEKRVWLNLELIKKPIHCLEYIIVHEMVHF